MLCEQVFDLISGHLDGQNTPEEEAALQAHLSGCEACRATLETMAALEDGTRALEAQPPEALQERIMKNIRKEAAKKKRSRWLGPGTAIGAVAAVLALLLGAGIVKLPQRQAADSIDAPAAVQETDAALSAAPNAETEAAGARTEMPVENDAVSDDMQYTAAVPAKADSIPMGSYGTSGVAQSDSAPLTEDGSLDVRSLPPLYTPQECMFCTELARNETVPVFAYWGLDADFPEQLTALQPAFETLFVQIICREDGEYYVIATDVDTAFAIQEWLLLNLPAEEPADTEPEPPEDEEGETDRISEFDPEYRCLVALLEAAEPTEPQEETLCWPETWSEYFAALFRAGKNWQIFYPEEEFVPEHGDPAYLVLFPVPPEPEE